ncbi:MAG: hypothetical protein ACRCV3_02290 [Desulfovibrionaceae bacterium]
MGRSGSYTLQHSAKENKKISENEKTPFKNKRSVSLCTLTSHKPLSSSAKIAKSASFSGPFLMHRSNTSSTYSPNGSNNTHSSSKLSERKSISIQEPKRTLPEAVSS